MNTVILIELPYSDPPYAAISIETGVPVEILSANHIEMNQVKMYLYVRYHEDCTIIFCLCLM